MEANWKLDDLCLVSGYGHYPFVVVDVGIKSFTMLTMKALDGVRCLRGTPAHITRPALAVGMWVRDKNLVRCRIREIDERLHFDQRVINGDLHSGGWNGKKPFWFPCKPPTVPVVGECLADATPWQEGDLCHLRGHGREVLYVQDAGMGMPRANIQLRAITGRKAIGLASEDFLFRPAPVRGMWVRRIGATDRQRVVNATSTQLHFDMNADGAHVFSSASPKYWVPVKPPIGMFTDPDLEMGRLQGQIERLKAGSIDAENARLELLGERDKLLRQVQATRGEIAGYLGEKLAAVKDRDGIKGELAKAQDVAASLRSRIIDLAQVASEHQDARVAADSRVETWRKEIEAMRSALVIEKQQLVAEREATRRLSRENTALKKQSNPVVM